MLRRDLRRSSAVRRARGDALPRAAGNGEAALDVLIVGGGQAELTTAFGMLKERHQRARHRREPGRGTRAVGHLRPHADLTRRRKDVGGVDPRRAEPVLRLVRDAVRRRAIRTLYKIPGIAIRWVRLRLVPPGARDRSATRTRLTRFRPENGLIACVQENVKGRARLRCATPARWCSRRIEGNGAPHVQDFIAGNLPRGAELYETIDFAHLKDKTSRGGARRRGGVLDRHRGGRACTCTCIIVPRSCAPIPMGWAEFSGYLAHFPDLPPEARWRFSRAFKRFKMGPPNTTMQHAALILQNIKVPRRALECGAVRRGAHPDR